MDKELLKIYTAEEDEAYISLSNPALTDLYPEWIQYRSTLTRLSSTIKRFNSVWNTWYKDKEISKIHLSDLNYLYLNQWANLAVKESDLTKKQYYLIASIAKQMLENNRVTARALAFHHT